MIKINKCDPPESLINTGKELVDKFKSLFDENPEGYIHGDPTFKFPEDYKSTDVKTALIKCQYNKCCFSEAKFNGDYPHVEHFRPKGRVDEYPKGPKNYPGYYWLAYEWSNLFLCKSIINTGYKRNYFPLVSDSRRNKNHNDNNIEDPLFINPSVDDPRDHIRFHNDEIIFKTERGRLNIEILGLRHPSFQEARRNRLELIKELKSLLQLAKIQGYDETNNDICANSLSKLNASALPDAEFSSMAIDFLSK